MTYEIDDTPLPRPRLPGSVHVALDHDEAIDRLASDLVTHADNCVREFGDFHVALSGDPMLMPLYRRLMYAPEYRWIPWRRTHLWFVHEACVGFDDERTTFRLISEFIGDHADLPPEQLHPIFASKPSAAEDYAATLREHLAWRERGQDRLDYVLLALGEDGGAAGLPRGVWPASAETPPASVSAASDGTSSAEPLVIRVNGDSDPDRISLTPAVINAARFVAVLATGPGREEAVSRAGTGSGDPIHAIRPVGGEMTWYVDLAACGAQDNSTDE